MSDKTAQEKALLVGMAFTIPARMKICKTQGVVQNNNPYGQPHFIDGRTFTDEEVALIEKVLKESAGLN